MSSWGLMRTLNLPTEETMNFKALAFQHVVNVLTSNPLTAKAANELVGEKVDTETLKNAQGLVELIVSRPKNRLVTMAKRAERRKTKKKSRPAKPKKAKAKTKKAKRTKKTKSSAGRRKKAKAKK